MYQSSRNLYASIHILKKELNSFNKTPIPPTIKIHPGAFKAAAIHKRIIKVIIHLPPYRLKVDLLKVFSFVAVYISL